MSIDAASAVRPASQAALHHCASQLGTGPASRTKPRGCPEQGARTCTELGDQQDRSAAHVAFQHPSALPPAVAMPFEKTPSRYGRNDLRIDLFVYAGNHTVGSGLARVSLQSIGVPAGGRPVARPDRLASATTVRTARRHLSRPRNHVPWHSSRRPPLDRSGPPSARRSGNLPDQLPRSRFTHPLECAGHNERFRSMGSAAGTSRTRIPSRPNRNSSFRNRRHPHPSGRTPEFQSDLHPFRSRIDTDGESGFSIMGVRLGGTRPRHGSGERCPAP